MSNSANQPDAATLALWRAVDAGNFNEIEAVLPRVADINTRNEHGVTALMRAAQHGDARVVRLLLAHGADANLARNDKFTALSLSAFFGHTEVVRILMEHGADSKASTRHGTSPRMWATARTFSEVATQLKNPAPPPRVEDRAVKAPELPKPPPPLAVAPVAPVASRPVTAAIVRTLKEPPEIWDLVHEAPRGFDAKAAFMGHLQSMRRGLLFRLATVAVLICASVIGVWVLRGAQARNNEVTPERPATDATATVKVEQENKGVETSTAPPVVATPAAAPASMVTPPALSVTTESFKTATTQRPRSHSSAATGRGMKWTPSERSTTGESVQRIQTVNEKTNAQTEQSNVKVPTESVTRTETVPQTKSSSPLSPQLITPAKNVSPKTKVIQWP